jgi:hypothetical protein
LGPQVSPEEVDTLPYSQPLLAELYGASVSERVASGPRAGRRVAKAGDAIGLDEIGITAGSRCAAVSGYSVHAGVCIPAHDRLRLERLCRYTGRPPVATERLSVLPDGRLLYRLRRRWRDGTTHMIFQPLELIERLAALVPPPRFNLVRYHGILAASAALRPLVIPETESEAQSPAPHRGCCVGNQALAGRTMPKTKRGFRPRNDSWAELMKRIFSIDVLACARCGGRMRILCAIHPPEAIRRILDCLGLPCRPPPIAGVATDTIESCYC